MAKEKVTQEKGHPAWRFLGPPAQEVREPEPGFSAARPCTVEKASASCRCPLRGLIDSVSPPHRGPEERADHPGPHSVRDGCAAAKAQEPNPPAPGTPPNVVAARLSAFRGVRAGCAPALRGPCAAVRVGR